MRQVKTLSRILVQVVLFFIVFFSSCAVSNKSYNPFKKYAADQLQQDFDLLQKGLEEFHPSLYWYTSKDSMDRFFSIYRSALKDSMTEQQFGFHIVAPLISRIRCGHTTLALSKQYVRYFNGVQLPSFPLYVKTFADTMIVTRNLNKQDTILKPGTRITSIDGLPVPSLKKTLFRFMSTDGFAETVNELRLSSNFPYYHRNILGLKRSYLIGWLDSSGRENSAEAPCFIPVTDTLKKEGIKKEKKERKKEKPVPKKPVYQTLSFDSATASAYMDLPGFDNGHGLRRFFRRSFRKLDEAGTRNLVIDLRRNGGGSVVNEVELARYIRSTRFRVADTAAAIRRHFRGYGKYFQDDFINRMIFFLFTAKRSDGRYHLRYWERRVFKPRKQRHFEGQVYLLTGGRTFSAASLFCNTLKGQPNVTVVGEETGGGAYGNNGLLIPYMSLPNTRIRVSMPLFRLIPDGSAIKDGKGVMPDIPVLPTIAAVRQRRDLPLETVKALLEKDLKKQ